MSMAKPQGLVPVGFDFSALKEIADSSPELLENLVAFLDHGLPEQLFEFFFGEFVPASEANSSDQLVYVLSITDVELERLFLASGANGLDNGHSISPFPSTYG